MATAIKLQEPVLSVAHLASSTPSYYVEEAEIGARAVTVTYFNESNPDSELEYKTIPLQELVDFTNEFYRAYTDAMIEGEHVQERLEIVGYDYLRDNLNSVVTDFLNAKV
jgi:hypothetical protein